MLVSSISSTAAGNAAAEESRSIARSSILILALFSAAFIGGAFAEDGAFPEYKVKAEMIERFTRFIKWPGEEAWTADQPFSIGILGKDQIKQYLEELAAGRLIKGHKVEIHELLDIKEVRRCHLVWIAAGAHMLLKAILDQTSGKPVLTVGDGEGYSQRGVHLCIIPADGRLGFEINFDQLKANSLQASSQLLRLGKIVKTVRREEGPPQ